MLDRIERILAGLGADSVHVEMDAAGHISVWLEVSDGREIFVTFTKKDVTCEYESRGDRDEEVNQIVTRLEDAQQEVLDILNEK